MTLYADATASPLGAGTRTGLGALLDEELSALVANYKRNIASRYRSLTPEEPELIPTGPLFASPKLDGELWFLVRRGSDLILVNPRGRVMAGDLPLLVEARATLAKTDEDLVLAGELFAARKAGRPRVGDVAAAVSDNAPERLGFAAFDVLRRGAADAQALPYEERLTLLRAWLEGGKRVAVIKTEVVNDRDNALRLFGEWASDGKGEGIVLRPTDGRIFKLKPFVTLDAAVIGLTVRADEPDQARSLLLALMRENGQLQIIGSCGNLGDDERRRALFALLAESTVDSNYRYASSSGALFRFVRPEVVVEVRLTDLQSADSSEKPVERMVLSYSAERGYEARRPMEGVSILHPVLERVRDDKSVNPADVRAAQVLERCHVDALDTVAEQVRLPASEVLRREVYVQHKGDKHGVRKLLLLQTHKETLDASYPAFVVHFTDYSSGRKDPLQREVRLASTRAQADAIADQMITDNIKRGWTRADEG
ncbi:MAG: ATP-dependent DNA ligase [Myxococcales bacterium]|nr:ATP-dependent DNA ligase [Myxococcales bacterium]MCB9626193.1 hypothetical protein [Sandaracinaceae bacterium]